jgi:predicted dehydrogenase
MILTSELRAIGRRNFLRTLAGTPALATLNAASLGQEPLSGGPVRIGFIGVGGEGRALLSRVNPASATVVAMADINPASLSRADEVLASRKQAPARHYTEFREMLEKENIEGVVIAVPLWAHADVSVPCLEAGKHVLCEKMMAWDMAGCERMRDAAQRNRRVLEIGYQRHYNPVYQSAYEGIIKRDILGDVHHVRLAWHRNGSWRRTGTPPSPGYDPSRWGYPTFEHLLNWRLYWKYSRGLFAELASHQLNAVNWFLGSSSRSVQATGGVHRFKDGREAHDHVYSIFDYGDGLTVTFSSLESNAFDERYEAFFGTKASLIIHNEVDALLFEEGTGAARPTGVEVSGRRGEAAVDVSETRPGAAGRGARRAAAQPQATGPDRAYALEAEITRFCAAIRTGQPVACGPDKAMDSARACIAATEAAIKSEKEQVGTA